MTTGRAPTMQEQAVARLALRMTDYRVEEFPDDVARYDWKRDRTLLVSYGSETFGDHKDKLGTLPTCTRTRSFDVTVLLRSLRGPTGVERTVNRIINHLFGWVPSSVGGGCVVPYSVSFQGEDEGTWRFVVSFQHASHAVGRRDEEADVDMPMNEDTTTTERPT